MHMDEKLALLASQGHIVPDRSILKTPEPTIAKMGRDENVSTEVLSKICEALKVDVGEIMEMIPDGTTSATNEEKQYVDR